MKSEGWVRYRLELWKDKLNDVTDEILRAVIEAVISELRLVVDG